MPDRRRSPTSGSWCPLPGSANDGYPCPVSEAELQAMAAAGGHDRPRYDLGTGATATLAPQPESRCCCSRSAPGVEGLPQTIDCEGGFPVQVKLMVKTAGDEVVAVRTLRLRFGTSEPNANPRIDGLAVRLTDDGRSPIGETPEVTIPRAGGRRC